jgi:putative transposase
MDISPDRKRPAHLPVYHLVNRPSIIFLTLCTKNRKQVLACDDSHSTLLAAWRESKGWIIGRYVIMPDHIHLFCAPSSFDESISLASWIRFWKSKATQQWHRPSKKPLWQREYWDRQLRSQESYSDKWSYVCENPVRAGLAVSSENWPYSGELHELRW